MKKLFLLASALTMLFIISCTKKEAAAILDNVTAQIGTVSFQTNSLGKVYSSTSNPTQFTITANGAAGGEYIVLAIKSFDRTNNLGTYTIGTATTSQAVGAYHKANTSSDEIAVSGQIIISNSGTDHINGTYNFTTQQGTVLSSGTFFVVLP
jgi:hypothetical protein